ncbi:MAG: hypothetical protein GF384_04760, partial [Elusimicrobia bacterium]|nr:hypothetical protein [Elusimicrobiota bacterium]
MRTKWLLLAVSLLVLPRFGMSQEQGEKLSKDAEMRKDKLFKFYFVSRDKNLEPQYLGYVEEWDEIDHKVYGFAIGKRLNLNT